MNNDLSKIDSYCPFCNGTNLRSFSAAAHDAPLGTDAIVSLIECTLCNVAWQWPRQRSPRESQDIFSAAYEQKAIGSYFDETRRIEVAKYQAEYLKDVINKSSPKLLDIGCGDGIFAQEMAVMGWTVTGLDPALPHKCNLLQTDQLSFKRELAPPNCKEELFDVVTLMDVIEHIDDPAHFLKYVISYLKPGGYLVLETGNYQSTGRIVEDRKWWNYQLDHRWYFAPPQIESLLSYNGMDNIFLVDKVLRPWVKQGKADSVSLKYDFLSTIKMLLRNPNHPISTCKINSRLVHAKRNWPKWHHLEIFTMIAHMPIHRNI